MHKVLLMMTLIDCVLNGCHSPRPSMGDTTLTSLQGHFAKNTVTSIKETQFKVFTDEASFDQWLGMATTMGSKIIRPDFSSQIVVAVILPVGNTERQVKWVSAREMENVWKVTYQTSGSLAVQSYSSVPIAVATLPKKAPVKRVEFLAQGMAKGTFSVEMH